MKRHNKFDNLPVYHECQDGRKKRKGQPKFHMQYVSTDIEVIFHPVHTVTALDKHFCFFLTTVLHVKFDKFPVCL